ncbi:MAG TPA: hypothetical protein VF787_17810 [Thermoanaerobaculia bacterium]
MTAAALSFLLGAIALPSLHLAFHELPHSHDGVSHHHNDDDHGADHDHHEAPDPHHGEHSLAHFSVAISDAPAAAFVLPFAGIVERALVATTMRHSSPAHVAVARFRGPPVRSC